MSRSARSPHRGAAGGAVHTIPASNRDNAYLNALTAPVLLALAWLIAWYLRIPLALPRNARSFDPIIVVPVFFAAGGIWYAGRAVLDGMRLRRYGDSRLELRDVRLGGTLRGTIRTTRDLAPTGDYALTLRCIETTATNDGRPNSTTQHHDILRWSAVATVAAATVRSSVGIPVDFAIPRDAPATWGDSDLGTARGVRWVLVIEAPLAGLDYYAVFRLVVAAADQSPR
jgi:hypothetical protein